MPGQASSTDVGLGHSASRLHRASRRLQLAPGKRVSSADARAASRIDREHRPRAAQSGARPPWSMLIIVQEWRHAYSIIARHESFAILRRCMLGSHCTSKPTLLNFAQQQLAYLFWPPQPLVQAPIPYAIVTLSICLMDIWMPFFYYFTASFPLRYRLTMIFRLSRLACSVRRHR